MSNIKLRGRHLTAAGVGINALTVEVYAVDANGLPTGAAVASTSTDITGVWQVLAAANLLHGTRYCVKIINGSEIQWLDGSDMALFFELSVASLLTLPSGHQVDSAGIPLAALAESVLKTSDLPSGVYVLGNPSVSRLIQFGYVTLNWTTGAQQSSGGNVTFPKAFTALEGLGFAMNVGNFNNDEWPVAPNGFNVGATGLTIYACGPKGVVAPRSAGCWWIAGGY
jgi:hypothetical protein